MGKVKKNAVLIQQRPYAALIDQASRAVAKREFDSFPSSFDSPIDVPETTRQEIASIIEGLNPTTTTESILAVQVAVSQILGLDSLYSGDKRLGLLLFRHSCDALQMIERGRQKVMEMNAIDAR